MIAGSCPNLLSAVRMLNSRLLLLLKFSSANFFPMLVLAVFLFSSELRGTFGFPETLRPSAAFLLPLEASDAGSGAVWKNLCRAD